VLPHRPALQIRRAGESLVLAWPAAAADVIAEGMAAADLGSDGWDTVELEVEELDGERIVPLPESSGAMLYRLKQQ